MKTLKFKKAHPAVILPTYADPGANGMDVRAFPGVEDTYFISEPGQNASWSIPPGTRMIIPTGLFPVIPEGHCLMVLPRSGLAAKQGVTVLNAPGLIDSSYNGEIKIILINHGDKEVRIQTGDRIAQLVLVKAPQTVIEETDTLPDTQRGAGGFGSTGIK